MLHTQMLISLLLSLSVAFSENSSLSNQVSSSHHNSTQTFPIEYIHATSHISTNAPCRFNISQSNTGSNPKTVASALQSSCSDGYEITLMDSIHYEYVTIIKTKNIPVLIQSGQLIRTVWSVNASSNYTILLNQGSLTLLNLGFNFTISIDQIVFPLIDSIFIINDHQNYMSLTITSCIFNGIDSNEYSCRIIEVYNIDYFKSTDCIFQNAFRQGSGLIQIYSYKTRSEFLFENSTFQNINTNYTNGFGALALFLYGSEQTLTVNKCIFINCSNSGTGSKGGALYIDSLDYSVNNNKIEVTNCLFINNSASKGGAIYSARVTYKCNFLYNEFNGNKNYGTYLRGYDAFLQWPNYSISQTADQANQKVINIFFGSTSTNRYSIYYEFVIDNIVDASGYVDLEIALEYCKSKTELTSDCACDINSTTYPESQCKKDNLCLTDLVHQNSTNCPCLSTADPRANGICPAYCNSKDEFTLNCVCELGSSIYPQATCEKDKLCIVDLIYQSVSNCPYLEFNDPRGESLCKFSDPDPTDPIIHDPPEKDPEIDQEQESGSKQDDEKTFNMIWIIFIVIGILAIVVIVIITFFIFRSRNKRKQIEIKKKNQVIQIEVKERIIEVQKQKISDSSIKQFQIRQISQLLQKQKQYSSSSSYSSEGQISQLIVSQSETSRVSQTHLETHLIPDLSQSKISKSQQFDTSSQTSETEQILTLEGQNLTNKNKQKVEQRTQTHKIDNKLKMKDSNMKQNKSEIQSDLNKEKESDSKRSQSKKKESQRTSSKSNVKYNEENKKNKAIKKKKSNKSQREIHENQQKDENDDKNKKNKEKKQNQSQTRQKSLKNKDRSDQNRTKTRNIVHSVKDDDNQSESSSESSSSSSSSTSSSSSPFSSSSSISSSSPISSPSLHINISETPHQSFASERSFRTASESHRGSLNESRSESLSSDFSDSADSGSRRETDQEDEEEFVPTEFQLKMHMKYQKFLNPIEEGRSRLDSINTERRKEDESPKSENSNSSDESKNYDNQIKNIKSSE